ncbi:unnamed protein product [Closterium sp. Naga37s-1]|nr:unnamed protein product [Closterium sp. Naga37s-1]
MLPLLLSPLARAESALLRRPAPSPAAAAPAGDQEVIWELHGDRWRRLIGGDSSSSASSSKGKKGQLVVEVELEGEEAANAYEEEHGRVVKGIVTSTGNGNGKAAGGRVLAGEEDERSRGGDMVARVVRGVKAAVVRWMLPEGYPDSVTPDYMEYTVWRMRQTVASEMNHVLTTQDTGSVTVTSHNHTLSLSFLPLFPLSLPFSLPSLASLPLFPLSLPFSLPSLASLPLFPLSLPFSLPSLASLPLFPLSLPFSLPSLASLPLFPLSLPPSLPSLASLPLFPLSLLQAMLYAVGLGKGAIPAAAAVNWAMLYAVGLGKGAIPAAAAVNWVLKDGLGYAAKVTLSQFGRHFDVSPKRSRLLSDLVENLSASLELLTATFPQYFVQLAAAAGAGFSASSLVQSATRNRFYAGLAGRRNFAELLTATFPQYFVQLAAAAGAGFSASSLVQSATRNRFYAGLAGRRNFAELLTATFPQYFVQLAAAAGAGFSASSLVQSATRNRFYARLAGRRNFAKLLTATFPQYFVQLAAAAGAGFSASSLVQSATRNRFYAGLAGRRNFAEYIVQLAAAAGAGFFRVEPCAERHQEPVLCWPGGQKEFCRGEMILPWVGQVRVPMGQVTGPVGGHSLPLSASLEILTLAVIRPARCCCWGGVFSIEPRAKRHEEPVLCRAGGQKKFRRGERACEGAFPPCLSASLELLTATFPQYFVQLVAAAGAGFLASSLVQSATRNRACWGALPPPSASLELVTATFPQYFVQLAAAAGAEFSASSLVQSATRNRFYAGLAGRRNFAKVLARAEAQGMVSKTLGMALGIAIAPHVGNRGPLLWATHGLLSAAHLFCNYRSYKAVQLRTLNPFRADIVLAEYVTNGRVPGVIDVNSQEPILPPLKSIFSPKRELDRVWGALGSSGAHRETSQPAPSPHFLSVPFYSNDNPPPAPGTGSENWIEFGVPLAAVAHTEREAETMADIFRGEKYLLGRDERTGQMQVVLKEGALPRDFLRAALQAAYH